jgi:hypothetical protein
LLLLLVALDLIAATLLNGPYTVHHAQYRAADIKNYSLRFPQGFPLPERESIVENRDGGQLAFQVLQYNLNIFYKQISSEGYNPFHLKGFQDLSDRHPVLFERMLHNPLLFLTGDVVPEKNMDDMVSEGSGNPKRIYVDNESMESFPTENVGNDEDSMARITSFSPQEIRASYRTPRNKRIVLLQNNYYGWKASIDGRPVDIAVVNHTLISAPAPAGYHEVVFLYRPTDVIIGFYLTAGVFLTCLVVLGIGVFFPWLWIFSGKVFDGK